VTNRLTFLALLLAVSGCAVGTRVVDLDTPAVWHGFESADDRVGHPVVLLVRDDRPSMERSIVGAVRNPDRMPTAAVRSSRSPVLWVDTCFREQLQHAGLMICEAEDVPGAPVLELRLLRCFAEGYWLPEAEIKVELAIRHRGELVWQQTCRASGSPWLPRLGGASGYRAAIEDAMETALDFVTDDIVLRIQELSTAP
jgi:hypothetical protein